MGADMWMEERNFRPRPNRAEWDGDDLLIFRDVFYHGWTLLWRGPVTKDNESLIKAMVGKIPPKPEPGPDEKFNVMEIHESILNHAGPGADTTAAISIDLTLAYVVDWLLERGNEDIAETLARIGDIK